MQENTRHWERLEDLFAVAADLPRDRQAAFVDQETASDPELRRELCALLDHDRIAGDRIAQAVQAAAPTLDWTGRRVGPYRVVREIGRGGMGLVFEAVRDDDEYRKTVALKIAPWWRDLDLLRERFRHERQILAGLEHPNIARFLDGGTHGGVPYFALEYVEGRRITYYARDLKLEEKIALFREVCSAVQYAHQSLIVHRDLKPANILVTGEGVPKLLDFGIAKLLSPFEEDRTATRVSPWTPDYASPEQVRSQLVTTRTDVYSLGLILFEMLTGQQAQTADTSSPLALDHSICEGEIPRASSKAPRALAKQLQGDLDTIIAKATQKDPGQRYASVAEFSDDLGRYLSGRPVRARNVSAAYRASKFLRRNWLPVGATALVVLSLAAGAIGFAWQARAANRSRIAAEAERHLAEDQRDRASREHGIAEQQRDTALRQQARAENLALEASAQRRRADQRTTQMSGLAQHAVFDLYTSIANLSGSFEARRAMLRTTVDYLEQLRPDKNDDPEFLRTLGDAYEEMGELQGNPVGPSLGDFAGALEYYRKALAIFESLTARNPSNARFFVSLTGPLEKMASALERSGKAVEAQDYYQKALLAARRAAALAPEDPHAVEQPGIVTRDLAVSLRASDPDRTEIYARESLEIYTRLSAKSPGNADYLDNIATGYNSLASVTSRRHDLKATLDYVRSGVEIRERLLKLKPDDVNVQRNLLVSYGRLGDVLGGAFENLGDAQGSAEAYRKCTALASQMLAKDPRSKTALSDLANSQEHLASVLSGDEQRQESLDLLARAVEGFETGAASSPASSSLHYSAGIALTLMAMRWRSAGDSARALDYVHRAIEHLMGLGTGTDAIQAQLALTRQLAAVLLAEQGDRGGAPEQARQAREIFERQAGTVNASFQGVAARYFERVGEMYQALALGKNSTPDHRLADWREAKNAYRRSAAEWRKTFASNREAEAAALESKVADGDARIELAARE